MRTVVFVEVKTRTSNLVRTPEQAVDHRKIRNIGIAANAYVKMNKINLELRFDVLTIVGDENDIPVIEYLEDAFNPMLVY
jgi:putative endonuclease